MLDYFQLMLEGRKGVGLVGSPYTRAATHKGKIEMFAVLAVYNIVCARMELLCPNILTNHMLHHISIMGSAVEWEKHLPTKQHSTHPRNNLEGTNNRFSYVRIVLLKKMDIHTGHGK